MTSLRYFLGLLLAILLLAQCPDDQKESQTKKGNQVLVNGRVDSSGVGVTYIPFFIQKEFNIKFEDPQATSSGSGKGKDAEIRNITKKQGKPDGERRFVVHRSTDRFLGFCEIR